MYKLTLADVRQKGLAALNAGKLSAQGPTPACLYRDKSGCPCIIGAAMPDDVIAEFSAFTQSQPVSNLQNVKFEIDDEELDVMTRLQMIHDRWAQIAARQTKPGAEISYSLNDVKDFNSAQLEAQLRKELTDA